MDPEHQTFRAWGGSVYPTSFILDANGQIRYTVIGPTDWNGDEVAAAVRSLLPKTRNRPTRR
jgi:hypothetical protein